MPSEPTAPPVRTRPRWILLLVGVLAALALVGGLVWWLGAPGAAPEVVATTRSTPESPYLNTDPSVRYVGAEACRKCHPGEYATYRETPHSRAFRPVDPATEPLPGVVEHEKSGLHYEMYVQDGVMRIRESIPLPDGSAPVLSDYPVQHVVGSGNSSLTYVTEEDGFLLESPTTWFTRPKHWAMSPGYDKPEHFGFGRSIGRQCLSCHVGRIESAGGADHRALEFKEDAIGCERCHGPGEKHVAFHEHDKLEAGTRDPTIVVPTDLERGLAEDICAQCHLDDTMVVTRPGADPTAWRPGLPAEHYRVHYGSARPSPLMRVVGHMDQMQASRCYQESGTMTCLSCHDPHGRPAPEDRAAHYRQRCLRCHDEEACGMDGPHRRAEHPDDSCIACHMPTVGTDIIHFAFTHHRVGLHAKDGEEEAGQDDVVDLVAKDDVSRVPELERRRNLGLAYLRFAHRPTGDPLHPHLPRAAFFDAIRKARTQLAAVYAAGQRDPRLLLDLAFLSTLPPVPGDGTPRRDRPDHETTLRYVQEALDAGAADDAPMRAQALALQVTALLNLRRLDEAQRILEELTKLRRDADDWIGLSQVHLERGRLPQAVAAVRKALGILPSHPRTQYWAARVLRDAGLDEESRLHARIGDQLEAVRRRSAPDRPK